MPPDAHPLVAERRDVRDRIVREQSLDDSVSCPDSGEDADEELMVEAAGIEPDDDEPNPSDPKGSSS
jgi:hypothetical protein